MRIHFIAIGGSAMHNLAIALHQNGHEVTGSDDLIGNPSRDRLAAHGLLPDKEGWYPSRITPGIDLVILGMHARKDNPELLKAQQLHLRIVSYPEFLYEHAVDKKRIVIAGSHGKTTITSMVLHAFKKNGMDADFMVGAMLEGFDNMVKLSAASPYMVLEGDEYFSSPLDRRSKFHHYHPDILLVSGIAWDHVNVFPDFTSYFATFRKLVAQLSPGSVLIYNSEDERVVDLTAYVSGEVRVIPYATPEYTVEDSKVYIGKEQYPVQIFGRHNVSNMQGAAEICRQAGISFRDFYRSMADFKGASRRLEILKKTDTFVLIRDFAHAPSKVRASVSAVREQYGSRTVTAVLELHTFSSLNKKFISHYKGSLDQADIPVVFYNPGEVQRKRLSALSREDIKEAFGNTELIVIDDKQVLWKFLTGLNTDHSVCLMMSSGRFGGLDWDSLIRHCR